jgi:hypothetical protein
MSQSAGHSIPTASLTTDEDYRIEVHDVSVNGDEAMRDTVANALRKVGVVELGFVDITIDEQGGIHVRGSEALQFRYSWYPSSEPVALVRPGAIALGRVED